MVDQVYDTLVYEVSISGKMRWNEICIDIVEVYRNIFQGQKQIIDLEELWQLLFEPDQDRQTKENKIKEYSNDSAHAEFFTNILPVLLKDDFKEGVRLGKELKLKYQGA